MEYENIFPTYIGKTKTLFSQDLMDQWKKYINLSEKQQLVKTHISTDTEDFLTKNQRILDNNLLLSPLKEQMLSHSRKYAKKIGIEFEDLQICNSWGYIVGKNNDYDNFHKHSNSLISGVYYLSKGSPIEFQSGFNESLPFQWPISNQETYDKFHHQIIPEEQLLILFPSNLSHRVTKNFTNERYCIAFNVIPKGYFGHSYGNFTL